MDDGERYTVGRFADLTGVSVRTLHHYDRIGLLPPAGRTASGYRVYRHEDLLRLQQILTLRYLGFGLARIAELLDRPDFDLQASLSIQREALRARRGRIEALEEVLGRLLEERVLTGRWNWETAAAVAVVVGRRLGEEDDMDERYSEDEIKRHWEELGRAAGPEEDRKSVV